MKLMITKASYKDAEIFNFIVKQEQQTTSYIKTRHLLQNENIFLWEPTLFQYFSLLVAASSEKYRKRVGSTK